MPDHLGADQRKVRDDTKEDKPIQGMWYFVIVFLKTINCNMVIIVFIVGGVLFSETEKELNGLILMHAEKIKENVPHFCFSCINFKRKLLAISRQRRLTNFMSKIFWVKLIEITEWMVIWVWYIDKIVN